MGLSLRPVTPNDELFLYQLVHDHMAETLYVSAWDPKLREPLLNMQIEGQRSSYAAQFPRADYGIIVYDDEAIGRLIMDRTPECHYLVDIMIAKEYRGKGIGTWRMHARRDDLRQLAIIYQQPAALAVVFKTETADCGQDEGAVLRVTELHGRVEIQPDYRGVQNAGERPRRGPGHLRDQNLDRLAV